MRTTASLYLRDCAKQHVFMDQSAVFRCSGGLDQAIFSSHDSENNPVIDHFHCREPCCLGRSQSHIRVKLAQQNWT